MDENLEFLKQTLGVLAKVNHAIQSSNMKNTILHSEVKEMLNKAKELNMKPLSKQYDKDHFGDWL